MIYKLKNIGAPETHCMWNRIQIYKIYITAKSSNTTIHKYSIIG